MKKIKKVKNIDNTNFWYNTFKQRHREWQESALLRLRAKVSPFETPEENHDKQVALAILLGEK